MPDNDKKAALHHKISSGKIASYGAHPKNIPDSTSTARVHNEEIKGENGKEYTGYTLSYIETSRVVSKNGKIVTEGYTSKISMGDLLSTEKLITSVNFDFDKSDKDSVVNAEKIDQAAKEINKLLRENPPVKIKIEGNTDATGDEKYNQKLSEKRASTVSQMILEKIDPDLRDRVYVSQKGNGEEKLTEQTQEQSEANRKVSIVAETTNNERYYRVVRLDSSAQKYFCGETYDKKLEQKVNREFQMEFLSGEKAANTFLGAKGNNISSNWKEASGAIVLEDIKDNNSPAHIKLTMNDPKNFALLVRAEDKDKVSVKQNSENEMEVSYNGKVVANVKYNLLDKTKHLNLENINVGAIDSKGEIKIKDQKDLAFNEPDKSMDSSVREALKNIDLSKMTASKEQYIELKSQPVTAYNLTNNLDNQRG